MSHIQCLVVKLQDTVYVTYLTCILTITIHRLRPRDDNFCLQMFAICSPREIREINHSQTLLVLQYYIYQCAESFREKFYRSL